MHQIFISYARDDKSFAYQLAEKLERFYTIWIDRGISAGLEWEQEIDAAIRNCEIFIVVISDASNKSEWVARETLRAEQLEKYRIPLLIEGEIPLRLLNVQVLDFREDFEGGMRDLLEALKRQITPEVRQENDIAQLLGDGIRAFLNDDIPTASSLIGQAIALDATLAASTAAFWEKLRNAPNTDFAASTMHDIFILEKVGDISPPAQINAPGNA